MDKEKILKDLLKSLLENRLNKLEKKNNEEIKDLKLIKSCFTKQEDLLKSFKIIKKIDRPQNKLLLKQKTGSLKISSLKRGSERLHTPLHKKANPKSKEKEKIIKKHSDDNFSHLNKSKIDGNYRTKKKKTTLDNFKINDNSSMRLRNNYKTPIRKIYHTALNSMTKYKKDKNHNNEPKTPTSSVYNDKTTVSNRRSGSNITSNKKNNIEFIDSIHRANKSYILENHNNNKYLNKSISNLTGSNLYITDNDTTPNENNQNQLGPPSLKKMIKINMNQKNKTNLNLKEFINKEKIQNNNNKNIFNNKSFGDWLGSNEGRDVLMSISNFLDIKTKYHLYSCQKQYLKYLFRLIEDTYTEFKENNKINPNSNVIQEKINEIKEKYSQNDLNINNAKFVLSKSCLKALELLNDEEHDKFFDNENYYLFSDDIYIVYKIIFQLIKNNEVKKTENKKDFFEKMGNFVHEHIKDKNQIGDFFKNMVKEFEFSEENIFQIKKIIKGNEEKLKPRNYSQICATTGLVIFLVKDILEYLGLNINTNKGCPVFVLMNLEFLEKVKTKLPNYLKFLKNLMNN